MLSRNKLPNTQGYDPSIEGGHWQLSVILRVFSRISSDLFIVIRSNIFLDDVIIEIVGERGVAKYLIQDNSIDLSCILPDI